MTPESIIFEVYGVRLRAAPRDGVFRTFKINELHNGFLMALEGAAVFGSIIYAERFVFRSEECITYQAEHKDNKEIRAEWLIWEIARSMLERGERLSSVDRQRLALCVSRLEAWL